MIVVKIELWSAITGTLSEIGRMYIANIGGTAVRGNYDVAVCRRGTTDVPAPVKPSGPKATRRGQVHDYPRLAFNVWRLVARSLRSAFPEEDRVHADHERCEDLIDWTQEARAYARILAHSYSTGNTPPPGVVEAALAYPSDDE